MNKKKIYSIKKFTSLNQTAIILLGLEILLKKIKSGFFYVKTKNFQRYSNKTLRLPPCKKKFKKRRKKKITELLKLDAILRYINVSLCVKWGDILSIRKKQNNFGN